MIENKDLIPGGIYECAGDRFKFLWLDGGGCLVFEPVNNGAKYYSRYTDKDEIKDPKRKKGMVGFDDAEYMEFIGMAEDV